MDIRITVETPFGKYGMLQQVDFESLDETISLYREAIRQDLVKEKNNG
jgi:hypothetical protein